MFSNFVDAFLNILCIYELILQNKIPFSVSLRYGVDVSIYHAFGSHTNVYVNNPQLVLGSRN